MAIIEENKNLYEDRKKENLLLLPPIKKLLLHFCPVYLLCLNKIPILDT